MAEAEVRIGRIGIVADEAVKDVDMAGGEDADIVEVQDTQPAEDEVADVEEVEDDEKAPARQTFLESVLSCLQLAARLILR